MTAPPAAPHVGRVDADDVARLVCLLETDFGAKPDRRGAVEHQYLLEALDRGEHTRFYACPPDEPAAVLYAGANGTLIPAGDAAAARWLGEVVERTDWRILIGPGALGWALLEHASRGLFRRRVNAREQRLMAAEQPVALPPPAGLRLARSADVEALTDFACALHVEDRMGPPISRSARWSVRNRMLESVDREATWVVERSGRLAAKVDLSLRSRTRGAQVAGVYVAREWRGRGIGASLVAAVAARCLEEGFPVVTLHVRGDNAPAIAAYERAGFHDEAAWVLAVR